MLENLQLTRPLAVFDIESTGIVPQRDRIVEIAVMKIMPDGTSRTTVLAVHPSGCSLSIGFLGFPDAW